jgi:hypothetical protein
MGRSKVRFICRMAGHKMYSITWNTGDFTVLCTRCEKRWQDDTRLGEHHD